MKKLGLLLSSLVLVFALAACESEPNTLSVYFVPSRDAAEILTATEPLKELLQRELAALGYDFDEIIIEVGTTYEAVGESMISGSADVGFLPGGTYAIYSVDGEVEVILTATRAGLNKDSANARDWNDGQPTTGDPNNQATYYRSLGVAGPSAQGRVLAGIINGGGSLSAADLSASTICVQSPTSGAGYVYPSIAIKELTGLNLGDLSNAVRSAGYGGAMSSLAAGQCDIAFIYADARRDYATQWTTDYGRTASIWAETDVVIVTPGIYNDTIAVSNATVDAGLKAALQTAFINIAADPVGIQVISIYSHQGYKRAVDSDYDGARSAQALLNN